MSIVIFWVTISPNLELNVKYDDDFFNLNYFNLVFSLVVKGIPTNSSEKREWYKLEIVRFNACFWKYSL